MCVRKHALACAVLAIHIVVYRVLHTTMLHLSRLSVLREPTRSLLHLRRSSKRLHDVAEYFHYTQAIVGSVPSSFVRHSLRFQEPREPIDLEKARSQHKFYVEKLKNTSSVQLAVTQIPSDERLPDLVFVEDPAVVLDGIALLTQMYPTSRSGEIVPIRGVLEEMGLDVISMRQPGAYLDGGDVLFTGREFLVGLSERTNKVRLNTCWYGQITILLVPL